MAMTKHTQLTLPQAISIMENAPNLNFNASPYVRTIGAFELESNDALAHSATHLPPATAGVTRELFSALYGFDMRLPKDERTGWAAELHAAAEETPEWQAVKRSAKGSAWATGIATTAIIEALRTTLNRIAKDFEVESEQEAWSKAQSDVELGAKSQDEANKWLSDQQNRLAAAAEYLRSDMGRAVVAGAAAKAAEDAMTEIDQYRSVLAGVGAPTYGDLAPPDRKLLKAVSENPSICRIAQLAGRFIAASSAMKRTDGGREREELTGIEFGDDLSLLTVRARQLPKTQFVRRYLDRQLPQWRVEGGNKERGPIVIAIDESRSMEGDRIVMAKAVALALLRTCIDENRPFAMVRFSTAVRLEVFPDPRQANPLLIISGFMSGGTDTARALDESTRAVKLLGDDADVVLITDGEDGEWSKGNFNCDARLHGIFIDAQALQVQRDALASYVHLTRDLENPDNIKTVLSL